MTTVRDLIDALCEFDLDAKVFYSRGDHSAEVIAVDAYPMCHHRTGSDTRWVKCLIDGCDEPNRTEGVLIV